MTSHEARSSDGASVDEPCVPLGECEGVVALPESQVDHCYNGYALGARLGLAIALALILVVVYLVAA
ncbi:hypothetical protein WKW80_27130 [Variovorax humicola]|uniref:Uncharacterized protein n=1 Tax=Variovorax humicola TaxID=1769758 RepID=A0ABU8W6X2_9BURK